MICYLSNYIITHIFKIFKIYILKKIELNKKIRFSSDDAISWANSCCEGYGCSECYCVSGNG